MLALTILLVLLVATVVVMIAVLAALHMLNLVPLLVPLIPLVLMIGTGLLGLIEILLLFGTKEDNRIAKKELMWLWGICILSALIWWFSTSLLW